MRYRSTKVKIGSQWVERKDYTRRTKRGWYVVVSLDGPVYRRLVERAKYEDRPVKYMAAKAILEWLNGQGVKP